MTDKYSAESDYDEDADLEFYYGEQSEGLSLEGCAYCGYGNKPY